MTYSDSAEARIVPMRLQKFLARAGVASRRGSENLMTAGRVCINGEIASELGTKVDPAVDVVTVDGQVVRLADGPVTLMLNKPAGVISASRAGEKDSRTGEICVTELITERIRGKMGTADYGTLISNYRNAFLNIDKMILDDLECCFMMIY